MEKRHGEKLPDHSQGATRERQGFPKLPPEQLFKAHDLLRAEEDKRHSAERVEGLRGMLHSDPIEREASKRAAWRHVEDGAAKVHGYKDRAVASLREKKKWLFGLPGRVTGAMIDFGADIVPEKVRRVGKRIGGAVRRGVRRLPMPKFVRELMK